MAITYAGFAATIAGLTISGVKRPYTEPPSVESSTNYPMSFPRVPSASREVATLSSAMDLKRVTCELVVVVERDTLDVSANRYSATIAMLDAIDTALATEAAASHQIDSWTITPEITEWGWALVATVEGSGGDE